MSLISGDTYQDKILAEIQDKTGISDYEIEIIKNVISKIKESIPTTLIGAQNRVSSIDSLRPELSNLIYVINKLHIEMESSYNKMYYLEYKKVNKMGRASRDAIEAEVMSKENILDRKEVLDNIEQVKWLLVDYKVSLDKARESTLKRWEDNRKLG